MIFYKLVFELNEYELYGLQPFPYFNFPWRNRKDRKMVLDCLEEENTPASFRMAVDLETDFMLESYHVMASWAVICIFSGIIGILITSASQLGHLNMLSMLSTGTLTLLLFSAYMILRWRMRLKKEEFVMYNSLMSNFDTWPDWENLEFESERS